MDELAFESQSNQHYSSSAHAQSNSEYLRERPEEIGDFVVVPPQHITHHSQKLDKSLRLSLADEERGRTNIQIKKITSQVPSTQEVGSLKSNNPELSSKASIALSGISGYDRLFKLIMIGSSNTGKTSILNRFVENQYQDEGMLTTIGVDLKSITLSMDEINVRLQIWDTAGQEQFSSLTNSYFRGCQGAIAVFDLTNPDSLNSLTVQIDLFKQFVAPQFQNNIALVGSKVDQTANRKVTSTEAQKFCSEYSCLAYFETSARDAINIDEAFFTVACTALKQDDNKRERKNSIKLNDEFGGGRQRARSDAGADMQKLFKQEQKKNSKCC